MSWKLFGQIVLLILVAVLIWCAAKCCMYKKCGFKYKHGQTHSIQK